MALSTLEWTQSRRAALRREGESDGELAALEAVGSSLTQLPLMARENESRPLNGQPRDDAGEDADRREDEEENASEGNKSLGRSDGEDVTMADYRFDINSLFQSELEEISVLEVFCIQNIL